MTLAACMLAAAAPAPAKSGVVAHVLTPVPRDALPGTRIAVVWTLSSRDQQGRRRPFNAEGVFVRALGTRSLVDYAGSQKPLGRYRAVVRVPSGGIRELRFGLMGLSNGTPAPVFFAVRGRVFR
jgi:hypothetical protein